MLHGFGPASAGRPVTGPTLFTPESTLLGSRPLTPVSPADVPDGEAGSTFRPMPLLLPPRERRPFPRHRTSSANKEPFTGPSNSPGVATWFVLSAPIRLWLPFFADLLPRAESPWAPPAATGGACLDLTSLGDFCNHTKGRAHRANVRTSREAPFLGPRIPRVPKASESRERWSESSTRKRRPHRPKSSKSACARRQQRPTRAPSSAPGSSSGFLSELESPRENRSTKTLPRTGRANGAGLWKGRGHFPLPGSTAGMPFPPDRHPIPTRGQVSK
jgi:hypothetical protein